MSDLKRDMAQRRMFSSDIVKSDVFLDMPPTTQNLYFHLGMEADDDGFVSPKKVMRSIGATDDDLKILLAKRFILPFDSGVVVIKHWLIHNLIRGDRYKETRYMVEKSMLGLNEWGAYTEKRVGVAPLPAVIEGKVVRQPNGNQTATQDRIGKDSIENTAPVGATFKELFKPTFNSSDGDTVKPKQPKDKKFDEICAWAVARRGFPFANIPKQRKALEKAKQLDISITRLKNRWIEMESETWRDGFDWTSVVSSFDKKQ